MFQTYEVRTEKEFIGNILLVISSDKYASNEEAIKSLWIEAQEYNSDVSYDIKNSDFQRERSNFTNENIDIDIFLSKVKLILSKVKDNLKEEGALSELAIIDKKLSDELNPNEVCVLHNGFSDYVVFLVCNNCYMFFSWVDVI